MNSLATHAITLRLLLLFSDGICGNVGDCKPGSTMMSCRHTDIQGIPPPAGLCGALQTVISLFYEWEGFSLRITVIGEDVQFIWVSVL